MSFELFNVDDSFAVLHDWETASVDAVITDPPYNAHVQNNLIHGTDAPNGGVGVPHQEVAYAPLAGFEFALDLVRVSRGWALSFCAIEDFGGFRAALETHDPKDWVKGSIWYRSNSQGQMTGDRPASACEGIAWMRRGKKVWNGRGSYGFWVCNSTRGEKDRHPQQKPLSLCLKLVALASNRGDVVLDPFCGSGRIGEACLLLGRSYIGLDLPPHPQTTKRGKVNVTETVDWVARATERLQLVESRLGAEGVAWSDAEALKLCTAKKSEMEEE